MKNLLILWLTALSFNALAQNFEGTIRWTIRTEITDPALKAQIDQSKKAAQDPARVAEMKKQMEDPSFQKMMEQNPQLKAQMDKMMAMAQGGGLESLIPTAIETKMKQKNVLTKIEGGMMPFDVLYISKENKSYKLNRENKTYAEEDVDQDEDTPQNTQVTRTNETTTILKYPCTQYVVTVSEQGQAFTHIVWATTAIMGLDADAMEKQYFIKGKRPSYYKDIKGVPLKIEMSTPQSAVIMEATEVTPRVLPASDFTIPADYQQADW